MKTYRRFKEGDIVWCVQIGVSGLFVVKGKVLNVASYLSNISRTMYYITVGEKCVTLDDHLTFSTEQNAYKYIQECRYKLDSERVSYSIEEPKYSVETEYDFGECILYRGEYHVVVGVHVCGEVQTVVLDRDGDIILVKEGDLK